jgi:glyoxylase-like metal-dependent hydrolase (beta-lactamase superfamily II)
MLASMNRHAEARAIDVRHLDRSRVICSWLVRDIIIDPGPTVSLDPVIEALEGEAPRAILLTHIHLDHAGGTGALVRRWPDVPVYVHERGARHMVDPSRLMDSAGRLYGDQMDRLWGEMVPIPQQNLRPLVGGEEVEGFRVAYTPGHASHHVSYLDVRSGMAFTGDTTGVRIEPEHFILAPTPPPDIDIEAWNESLDVIESWQPTALGITHFGRVSDPAEHIPRFRETLNTWAEKAREMSPEQYEGFVRSELAASTDEAGVEAYSQGAPPSHLYGGLRRYWDRKDA